MILYDSAGNMNFRDYGIMLPVSPARAGRILEFLEGNFVSGARGATMPFPGPVLTTGDAIRYLAMGGADGLRGAEAVISREDLERVHSAGYIASLLGDKGGGLEQALLLAYELLDAEGRPRRYEPEKALMPLSGLFSRIVAQMGASYLACALALSNASGFCYFLGGGMHHARRDRGAGFCLLNDVIIAARKIQAEGKAAFIWIIDLDAHKGDGSAELVAFARERGELAGLGGGAPAGKCQILTLSIHMACGWPLDKESLAAAEKGHAPLVPSDIDIGIEAGEEAEYLPRLREGITRLETMTAGRAADFVIVVDGADPYRYDELPSCGLLNLSLEQCLERDNYVYSYLKERRIPSAWIMAGGYGERAWEPTAHFLAGLR